MAFNKGKNRIVQIIFAILISVLYIDAACVNAANKQPEPGGKPFLLSVEPGERSAALTWQKAPDPVTYYLVRYGLTKENPEYGLSNIGNRDTTSFTVQELTNGQKYYFQVRAGNSCRPGDFSNTLSAIPGKPKVTFKKPNLSMYKQILGTALTNEISEKKNTQPVEDVLKTSQNCAFTCYSLPILIGEIILPIIFLYFSIRFRNLKTSFSVMIPIAGYVIFYFINGSCNSYIFLCKYFLPISILTYLLTLILHKYYFFRLHIKKGQLSKN